MFDKNWLLNVIEYLFVLVLLVVISMQFLFGKFLWGIEEFMLIVINLCCYLQCKPFLNCFSRQLVNLKQALNGACLLSTFVVWIGVFFRYGK
jgi:hypothetical protein